MACSTLDWACPFFVSHNRQKTTNPKYHFLFNHCLVMESPGIILTRYKTVRKVNVKLQKSFCRGTACLSPYGGVSRPFKKIVASCGLTGNIHSGCYGVWSIPDYHSYPRIY